MTTEYETEWLGDEWFDRLSTSVGPMAHLPNNGAAYHTGEQVITHLNRALGPLNWSFHVLDQGEEEDSDECWAFVEIRAIIGGVIVTKQDYGSQAIKRSRTTKKYLSKWDDKKGAITDGLKRAARLLGVGLDAWANEKAPSWHPDIDDDGASDDMRRATSKLKATPEGARRCSAKIGVGEADQDHCPRIVPAGEPIMASMREFDRPFCEEHLNLARGHIAALAAADIEARAKQVNDGDDIASDMAMQTGTDLVGEMMGADAPESPPEAHTEAPDDPASDEPEEANQAPDEDSDIRIINGRSIRARTCDAKDKATQTLCGYKLWPGTDETYGDESFKVSVLISEAIAKYKRVLCPEHFIRMREYTAKQAAAS